MTKGGFGLEPAHGRLRQSAHDTATSTSWLAMVGSVTASRFDPSAVRSSRSGPGNFLPSWIIKRVRFFDRSILQPPANTPSTSRFPTRPLGIRSPSKNRDLSAWERRRLSYSGRNRGGAGVSGSGRGASGRSNSSIPCSSGNVTKLGRNLFTTSASPVNPDQTLMSFWAAGPNAPRYRRMT